MSHRISQRLLQWEKRTGNAPPIGSFLRHGFSYGTLPVSLGKERSSPRPCPCGVSGEAGDTSKARSAPALAAFLLCRSGAAACPGPPQGHRRPGRAGAGAERYRLPATAAGGG